MFEFGNVQSLHAANKHRLSGLQPRPTMSAPSRLFPHEELHQLCSFVKYQKVCVDRGDDGALGWAELVQKEGAECLRADLH